MNNSVIFFAAVLMLVCDIFNFSLNALLLDDAIESAVLTQYNQIGGWFYEKSPDFLMKAGSTFASRTYGILDMIPDSVWSTVPVTLVSCILGCLAVPYIIFKIDDFFQAIGERKTTKSKTAGS